MTSHDASQPGSARAWRSLLLLLTPATLLMAADRAVLTVSAPVFTRDYGFDLTQLGLLFTAFFWAYALMQIPAGALVERFGSKWTMCGAILLWSAMTALTPFARSFGLLLLVRVLLGVGQSADWPASIAAISRLFPPAARAQANSVLLCALYAAPIAAAPLTGWLLVAMGLKGVFLICGVVGFVFAAIFAALYGQDIHREGRAPSARAAAPGARLGLGTLLASPSVWALAAAYICTGASVSFYTVWFPTYLARARGLPVTAIGVDVGIMSAALCLAALGGGQVARAMVRWRGAVWRGRQTMGAGALLIAALCAPACLLATSHALCLTMACIAAAALGLAQVNAWTSVQELAGPATGTLTGVINFVGNMASGSAPAISALLVARSGGWSSSFLLLGAIGLLGALAWSRVRVDRPLSLTGDIL
ncbi:MFS transporter [Novosphingobium rosa]|uniref:MFS transporter n=1 Tax=Novosphingobium rosa TaxID=76978 RepID=UPI00082E0BE9|nr:MFS transporter [Novosphingobium rosa]